MEICFASSPAPLAVNYCFPQKGGDEGVVYANYLMFSTYVCIQHKIYKTIGEDRTKKHGTHGATLLRKNTPHLKIS